MTIIEHELYQTIITNMRKQTEQQKTLIETHNAILEELKKLNKTMQKSIHESGQRSPF